MARKKTLKLDFETMGELKQNPFASLASLTGEAGKPGFTETHSEREMPTEAVVPKRQKEKLLIRLEKRPGGRVVTTIRHFEGDADALVSELRKKLATGGTVEDGVVELRGDQRERLLPLLEAKGLPHRLA